MRTVFRSATLFVGDYRCRPACGQCGAEEHSLSDEIVFVRAGLFVKHLGHTQVVGNPNRMVFFNRVDPYRVSHPVPGGDDCTVFALAPPVLTDLLRSVNPGGHADGDRPFQVSDAPLEAPLFLRHLKVLRAIQRRVLTDVAAEEAVVDLTECSVRAALAARGVRSPRRPGTTRAHREAARAAELLLTSQYREPLSLDAIARAVHLSPFHLCRVFREQTGVSIHAYRNRLRLRAALPPLAESRSDLTELALELGFADHSHFTNAFRREFGLTPSAFRRSVRSERLREMSRTLQV